MIKAIVSNREAGRKGEREREREDKKERRKKAKSSQPEELANEPE